MLTSSVNYAFELEIFFLSNANNLSIPLLTLCYYAMGYEIASAYFFLSPILN